jgi:hypothetical protein
MIKSNNNKYKLLIQKKSLSFGDNKYLIKDLKINFYKYILD